MPRSVNVYTSGWRATGVNVQVPQYEMVVKIDWTRNNGETATATRTVRFPNILADMPAEMVKTAMEDLLLQYARLKAGVDND